MATSGCRASELPPWQELWRTTCRSAGSMTTGFSGVQRAAEASSSPIWTHSMACPGTGLAITSDDVGTACQIHVPASSVCTPVPGGYLCAQAASFCGTSSSCTAVAPTDRTTSEWRNSSPDSGQALSSGDTSDFAVRSPT